LLIGRVDENQSAALRRRQPRAQALESVSQLNTQVAMTFDGSFQRVSFGRDDFAEDGPVAGAKLVSGDQRRARVRAGILLLPANVADQTRVGAQLVRR